MVGTAVTCTCERFSPCEHLNFLNLIHFFHKEQQLPYETQEVCASRSLGTVTPSPSTPAAVCPPTQQTEKTPTACVHPLASTHRENKVRIGGQSKV